MSAGWAAIALVMGYLIGSALQPRDSTDTPDKRSGMVLHKDALTGCHYLSKPFGGISPRLRPDGTQLCEQ